MRSVVLLPSLSTATSKIPPRNLGDAPVSSSICMPKRRSTSFSGGEEAHDTTGFLPDPEFRSTRSRSQFRSDLAIIQVNLFKTMDPFRERGFDPPSTPTFLKAARLFRLHRPATAAAIVPRASGDATWLPVLTFKKGTPLPPKDRLATREQTWLS